MRLTIEESGFKVWYYIKAFEVMRLVNYPEIDEFNITMWGKFITK